MAAFAAGWALLFSGAGLLLYLWNARGLSRIAAGFLVRLDPEGLRITHRGRTWRSRWTEVRADFRIRTGEDCDEEVLTFHGPSGPFEYPWLLDPADEADLFAVLRATFPGASLPVRYYTPEIHGMMIALEDITNPAGVEDVCQRLLAKAAGLSPDGFGTLPILEGCARALARVGRPEKAAGLEGRIEDLWRRLGPT